MCLLCVLYPTIQNYHLGINDQIVALPLWHLLTASVAFAETPAAGAADDPVNPRMGIVPRGNTAAVAEVRRAAWGV